MLRLAQSEPDTWEAQKHVEAQHKAPPAAETPVRTAASHRQHNHLQKQGELL